MSFTYKTSPTSFLKNNNNKNQPLKVCTRATKRNHSRVCSLLKISQSLAQQATSSGGLTVSFQSENIFTIMMKRFHGMPFVIWQGARKNYGAILGGKMGWSSEKQKLMNYLDNFQQLTKLIIKPLECNDQQSNKIKSTSKSYPQFTGKLLKYNSFSLTFCVIFFGNFFYVYFFIYTVFL